MSCPSLSLVFVIKTSSLTLLINLVKSRSTAASTEVIIKYDKYNKFDAYKFNGFTGMLARFVKAKQLLDNQVCSCELNSAYKNNALLVGN